MDYKALAEDFLRKKYLGQKIPFQKFLNDSHQGEIMVLQMLLKISVTEPDLVINAGLIGSNLGFTNARTTAILTSLEKKDLIKREINPDNRRQIIVTLTNLGIYTAQKRKEILLQSVTALLEQLGETDAVEYIRLTEKVTTILESPTNTFLANNSNFEDNL